MNARWRARIDELIGRYPRLLGVSVHNKLRAEGFDGRLPDGDPCAARRSAVLGSGRRRRCRCRSTPTRARKPSSTSATCRTGRARWGWATPLWCFGMILCWSRWRMWWFTTSEDRQHTFEGLVRFFEAVGGVPAACRTDRMGALGRRRADGSSCTRRRSAFAAHHGDEDHVVSGAATRSARARSSGRSVSCKRRSCPRSSSTASPPTSAELNRRAAAWLDRACPCGAVAVDG